MWNTKTQLWCCALYHQLRATPRNLADSQVRNLKHVHLSWTAAEIQIESLSKTFPRDLTGNVNYQISRAMRSASHGRKESPRKRASNGLCWHLPYLSPLHQHRQSNQHFNFQPHTARSRLSKRNVLSKLKWQLLELKIVWKHLSGSVQLLGF